MPVRASMEYIITFVRELIHDPAGASQQFSDQQIQDRLDLGRLNLYNHPLCPKDTRTTGGTIEWHDFFAGYQFWETDYVIQGSNGTLAPSDVAEPLIGKFHYNGHTPQPLMITGKVYNVYGVAGSLITTVIGTLRNSITSWTADGTTVQRLNQLKTLEDLAKLYAGRAWGWGNTSQVKLVRKDIRN